MTDHVVDKFGQQIFDQLTGQAPAIQPQPPPVIQPPPNLHQTAETMTDNLVQAGDGMLTGVGGDGTYVVVGFGIGFVTGAVVEHHTGAYGKASNAFKKVRTDGKHGGSQGSEPS
jgi:hypothetical protein